MSAVRVAIIGVGLHPFGRFGDKSAIEMGAEAVRSACADAGVQWKDVQFAFGGSFEVDNPDAVVGLLGLTGIPFMDVYNGCATAATARVTTAAYLVGGEPVHGHLLGVVAAEGVEGVRHGRHLRSGRCWQWCRTAARRGWRGRGRGGP